MCASTTGIATAIDVQTADDLDRFRAPPGLPELSLDEVSASGADARWLLSDSTGVIARCSLWWRATPPYADHRVGLIGHYAAHNASAGTRLLALACDRLATQGCTLAVGPMDGSTARRYRLVTERGSEPPFFLEPENPDDWPAHWTAAGFQSVAQYCSALQPTLEGTGPGTADLASRFEAEGVRIRPLDLEHFDDELRRIFTVAAASFRESFFAMPLDEPAFLAQYRPLRPCIQPDLVLLAERGEQLAGFVFALPDWLEARRSQVATTVVVKTLAVLPEYAGQGLATLLSACLQERAVGLGFTRAIHALMHERNVSRRVSERFRGHIFRRYTLYARPLHEQPGAS